MTHSVLQCAQNCFPWQMTECHPKCEYSYGYGRILLRDAQGPHIVCVRDFSPNPVRIAAFRAAPLIPDCENRGGSWRTLLILVSYPEEIVLYIQTLKNVLSALIHVDRRVVPSFDDPCDRVRLEAFA
jgi:hypothetical protein